MPSLRAFIASVALALTSVPFLTTSAVGQSPLARASAAKAAVTDSAGTSAQTASVAAPQTSNDRYKDGIVIWETPPDANVPFLLKFNINTQIRYLNTQNSDETYHRPSGREP